MTGLAVSPPATLPQIRNWYWRGWKIRYQVVPAVQSEAPPLPPILLLHGFGASLDQWRNNFAELAQQRPVYALDLLGFGHSQKAATVFNTDLWSAQVHDFWQTWIGCPVVLVGHSLGALVALNNAVQYPQMVDRLVMLTLPAAREELLSGWMETLSRTMERVFSTPLLIRPLFYLVRQPWLIRKVLRGIYQAPERVDETLVEQFVRPTAERGAARTLCYLVRSRTELQFTPETKKLIPQLTMPTLLLWGQVDTVIPPAWGEQVAPLNPHVTFRVIPQGGHCFYDDQPERVNQEIMDWLQATGAGDGDRRS
jgi:pimeloyl-ACP methyl ester carboxylesterase